MVIVAVCALQLMPQTVFAAQKLGQAGFERSLSDTYGFVNTFENGQHVSYVSGRTGYAARSSHAGDDGSGTSDFCLTTATSYWPASNQLYLKYYLKYEAEYINTSSNVKLLWTYGSDFHNEIIYSADSTSGVFNVRWQCSGGGAGWERGTKITKYGSASYRKGNWMLVEIYFKLSSGTNHMNPDGIQWIKINGQTVISDNTVITGTPGRMSSPSINATANQATGHGWWQIDDFEVWDGIPNVEEAAGDDPVESDSLNPPTGLMVLQ